MRHGLRTQPAPLVRGSSRRIMTMRFRPANIRVINRRVCSWAIIGPAVPNKTRSKAHQRERVPAPPPVDVSVDARTVLAIKGSLRRAKNGRALARCAPLWTGEIGDGRLRRDHEDEAGFVDHCRRTSKKKTERLTYPILQNLTDTTPKSVRARQVCTSAAGYVQR